MFKLLGYSEFNHLIIIIFFKCLSPKGNIHQKKEKIAPAIPSKRKCLPYIFYCNNLFDFIFNFCSLVE